MLKPVSKSPEERAPLSRERVLRGAVAIADASGIRAVTIRSLARELGVKPMSLYHYVAGKDEILDGIVDLVFSEIDDAVGRRRLAVGDAPASDLGPSRAEAPPLGDRPPWSREPPRAPRRCDTATRPSAPCAEPASRWQ
jgi:AcrR family transcriptional regulator